MPKGPRVHEIFSNEALDRSTAFKYNEQESVEQTKLSKKTVPAPMAPSMKKFGAHKPKILAGSDDDDHLIQNNTGVSLEKSLLRRKTSPAPDVPDSETPKPRVTLTKPKPFVIGDKDVPMILSTVGDNDIADTDVNGNREDEVDDIHIYNTVLEKDDRASSLSSLHNSESSTLISPSQHDEVSLGLDNPALVEDEPPTVPEDTQLVEQRSPPAPQDVNIYLVPQIPEMVSSPTQDVSMVSEGDGEPDGVYIPDPDYDDVEQTLDFAEEDTDASDGTGDERSPRRSAPLRPIVTKDRPLSQVYEGEDLSHFLSDDEAPVEPYVEPRNQKKKAAPKTLPRQPPKLNEKHSMFKPPPTNTYTKRKGGKGKQPPAFNSVRSFSYADSKFGTMSKAKGASMSSSISEYGDDSQSFLYGSSSYESFLRSRHGEDVFPPDSSDSGVDMDDNFNQLRKDSGMWKKLTWRFKNRSSKDYSLEQC